MNAENILKLVDAGFSKEEILALTGTAQPKEADAPKEAPAEPEPAKDQPAKPAPETSDPNAERYAELLDAMQKLTGAIQAGNILNSSNKEQPQMSAEDILAEVVAPKPKKGVK